MLDSSDKDVESTETVKTRLSGRKVFVEIEPSERTSGYGWGLWSHSFVWRRRCGKERLASWISS